MTPTNKLRWVKRDWLATNLAIRSVCGETLVLQQWWEYVILPNTTCDVFIPDSPNGVHGEWRDVPIEEEK